MGITTSCAGDGCGRCGRKATESSSRVNNSRQNYDYPPGHQSPNGQDPKSAFMEEPLESDLWDAKKEQLSKAGQKMEIEAPGVVEDWTNGNSDHLANGVPDTSERSPLKDHIGSPAADLTPEKVEIQVPAGRENEGFVEAPKQTEPEPEEGAQEGGTSSPPTNNERRMSWRRAAKKALLAKNMGAKIAIENKIGSKLTGTMADIALELQKGIAAEGRGQEHPNFKAPDGELFNRCRAACGYGKVRYFATMGLQDGLTEPNLALIGDKDAAGKSGSFFFLSPDQQLIAKSCTREDWRVLRRILPEYTDFVENARTKADARKSSEGKGQPISSGGRTSFKQDSAGFVRGFTETLLPRFLGLYKLTPPGDSKAEPVRVLIMANVFGGAMSIERRYDLKGSTHGRKASKKECAKRAPTYKDIDWVAVEPGLSLSVSNREMLLESIKLDLDFLAKHGLMDYSLLVGVHDIAQDAPSVYEAMNVVTVRDNTRHCYLGIIDVLTPYKIRKRAETFFMGTIVCGRDISCQHPRVYADRFFRFVDKQVFHIEKR